MEFEFPHLEEALILYTDLVFQVLWLRISISRIVPFSFDEQLMKFTLVQQVTTKEATFLPQRFRAQDDNPFIY